MLLQVRIGSGGGSGVSYRGEGPGAIFSTITDPTNWAYLAAIAVLLMIGIVLIYW